MMTFPVKTILESLYDRFSSALDSQKYEVLQLLQDSYYELCSATSWEVLRDAITYQPDADGMWLPPDVLGIDCVTNGTNIWSESSLAASLNKNSCEKRWYIPESSRNPLVHGSGLNISNGSTEFTGADNVTEEHVGEYVRIGGVNELVQIGSVGNLSEPWNGPDQTGASYNVRPAGTRRIKLLAEYSEPETTEDITIFCWRLPRQIHDETGVCVLPRADILELATAEKIYGILKDYENRKSVQRDLYGSKGRYTGKLEKAISSNPDFVPPKIPRNRNGSIAGYGAR